MTWGDARRVVAAAVLVATAGCADEQDGALGRAEPEPASEPDPEPSTGMELEWSVDDVQFVSSPQRAWAGSEQVVVTVGRDGDEVFLLAYSASGEQLWRRPTTGSELAPWVPLEPIVDGSRVYHVAPGADGDHVEVVDIASGEVAWSSTPAAGGFTDQLRFCNASEYFVCITADDDGPWKIDIDTGAVEPVTDYAGVELAGVGRRLLHLDDGSFMNADLYELDGGDVALVAGGEVYWQLPPSELFGRADPSPEVRWHHAVSDDVVIAAIPPVEGGPVGEAGGEGDSIAGIDLVTGDTLWQRPGRLHCGSLAGLLGDTFGVPWTRCVTANPVPLRRGRHAGAGTEAAVGTSGVEGFDPVTGETTWRVDTGGTAAMWAAEGAVVRVDATTFVLRPDDDRRLVVDTRDGSTPEVPAQATGWCVTDHMYSEGIRTRVGAPLLYPCDLDGRARPVPGEPDEAIGARLGEVFVWIDRSGLHGAR